jgi:hypothetical protein
MHRGVMRNSHDDPVAFYPFALARRFVPGGANGSLELYLTHEQCKNQAVEQKTWCL